MVKKKMRFWVVTVVMALGFLSAGLVTSARAESVTLTFQQFIPPVGIMADQYRVWAKLIEERTQGRVKINMLWSNSLFSMTEALQSVNAGVADLGFGTGAYYPSQLPTLLSLEHAYNATDVWVGMKALSNLVFKDDTAIQNEYKANGVIAVIPYGSGTFQWFCNGDWKSSADFKGKVGRTMGGARKTWYENMGLKPIFLPVTDIYEAVQRGTVWGYENTLNLSNDLKLFEVTKTLAVLNSGVVMSSYTVMNLKKFNALSKEDQKIMIDTGIEWAQNNMARALIDKEAQLVKEWKEKRGVQVVYPAAEDVAKMRKMGRDAAMELAVSLDKKNAPNGHALNTLKLLWKEVDSAEKELKEKGYPWTRK